TLTMAGESGIGAMSFSLAGPERFAERVRHYYDAFERCVPIGRVVNPNILATAGDLMCGATEEQTDSMIGTAGGFFGFALNHYAIKGGHRPGRTTLWSDFQATRAADPLGIKRADAVGTPARVRETLRKYEDAGADQVMFMLPPVSHEVN